MDQDECECGFEMLYCDNQIIFSFCAIELGAIVAEYTKTVENIELK